MTYKNYLKTNHWKNTRENYLNKKGGLCRICGREKIQLHHRRYTNDKGSILFNEKISDLFGLCFSCHGTWHGMYKNKVMKFKTMMRIKRLMRLGVVRKWAFIIATQGRLQRRIFHLIRDNPELLIIGDRTTRLPSKGGELTMPDDPTRHQPNERA